MERSHRGRVRTLGKRVVLNGARGFESPPLLFGNRENVPSELKGTFFRYSNQKCSDYIFLNILQ